MIGQLNEHPLAELIREIALAGLSGALRLSKERAKAVVYFDGGDIVYAASNIRTYRLAECVRRWGVLTGQQIDEAQSKASDLEFGAALVEAGVLNQESFDELLAHQVSELLCHALLWTNGDWEFDPRVRIPVDVRRKIKPFELMMEGARRLPAAFIVSRFENRDMLLSLKDNPSNDLKLQPSEAFLLTRASAPISIREMLAVCGLSEAEGLRAAYALFLGSHLHIEDWPQAMTAEALAKARAVKAASPTQAAGQSKAEKKEVKPVPAPAEEVDEKSELEALFARLNLSTNYYQVLGVVRPASDADIKRAYHSLARRFHPDRFRKSVDDALHARIEAAFVNIARAYETLKDSSSRAAYDSTLMRQGGSGMASQPITNQENSFAKSAAEGSSEQARPASSRPVSADESFHAEERFKQGMDAMRGGNLSFAIGCLSEAVRLDPSQPRYRAYYGRALAGDERLRRSAEAELKAAIALDEKNASYRVMLAELYIQIGLARRAQSELERALSIEPRNESARQLLKKLRNGG